MEFAEVLVPQVGGVLKTAGEKAAAERTVRHEADSQLAARGEYAFLGIACPQRVLGLQGSDWMRGVGAPDGLFAGFGEPEVADLALFDEPGHGADGLLDRRLGI